MQAHGRPRGLPRRVPLAQQFSNAETVRAEELGWDPAEMREFFRIIDEQAHHMRGLINDLLDAGRIEAGTLSVAREAVPVAGWWTCAANRPRSP